MLNEVNMLDLESLSQSILNREQSNKLLLTHLNELSSIFSCLSF